MAALVIKDSWEMVLDAVTGQNIERSNVKRTFEVIKIPGHRAGDAVCHFEMKVLRVTFKKEVWQLPLLCDFSKPHEATNGVLKCQRVGGANAGTSITPGLSI